MLDEQGNVYECVICEDIEPCEQCMRPEPGCYGCMGIGYMSAWGMSNRCPCIYTFDPAEDIPSNWQIAAQLPQGSE